MKLFRELHAALLACALLAGPAIATTPVAKTDAGDVAGADADGVRAFLGIPYAAPPMGKDRWRAPQPVAPWQGLREANAFGPNCPQAIVPGGFGPWTQEYVPAGAVSEDCLSLNVWSLPPSKAAPLPVLVWIHGGGFTSGSASVPVYDGAALARQGVVVVSINYRLGLLGFLGSRDFRETGGGNFGLQDQIAALQWVKRNIRAFGGDPARVTIAGQSAGAASVHALILSPLARGLFAGAIPQSGVGLGLDVDLGLASRDSAEKGAAAFLAAAGAGSIDKARALDLSQLTAAYMKMGGRPGQIDGYRPAPYADGAVLPLDPKAAFAEGAYNDTPVLIGMTADEGSGLNASYRTTDPERYQALLRDRFGALAADFGTLYPATSPSTSFPAIIRDGGLVSLLNWGEARAKTSRHPLYAYVWTHVEPGPKSALYGAFHTSEVPYVFRTLDKAPDRGFAEADRRISLAVSQYWVNFIKRGDPNGVGLPAWPGFGHRDALIELGDSFGPYTAPDQVKLDLFRRYLASGGHLLVF